MATARPPTTAGARITANGLTAKAIVRSRNRTQISDRNACMATLRYLQSTPVDSSAAAEAPLRALAAAAALLCGQFHQPPHFLDRLGIVVHLQAQHDVVVQPHAAI